MDPVSAFIYDDLSAATRSGEYYPDLVLGAGLQRVQAPALENRLGEVGQEAVQMP